MLHEQIREIVMFRRRKELTITQKIKSYFWPSIGWKKYMRYLLLRLNRMGSSPYSVAAGVACGSAISFTPFVGLHFVLAAITAFLCGGNILASALGTAMGNPWTFPIIWVSVYYTGRWFLGEDGTINFSFLEVFEKGMHALMSFDFSDFAADVWPVIKPMIVGCVPFYIVAWIVTYYVVKKALMGLRKKKSEAK